MSGRFAVVERWQGGGTFLVCFPLENSNVNSVESVSVQQESPKGSDPLGAMVENTKQEVLSSQPTNLIAEVKIDQAVPLLYIQVYISKLFSNSLLQIEFDSSQPKDGTTTTVPEPLVLHLTSHLSTWASSFSFESSQFCKQAKQALETFKSEARKEKMEQIENILAS
jgi:hypothetical protein